MSEFDSRMYVKFATEVCHNRAKKSWREWLEHSTYDAAYKEFKRLSKTYGYDNVRLVKKTWLNIKRTEMLH